MTLSKLRKSVSGPSFERVSGQLTPGLQSEICLIKVSHRSNFQGVLCVEFLQRSFLVALVMADANQLSSGQHPLTNKYGHIRGLFLYSTTEGQNGPKIYQHYSHLLCLSFRMYFSPLITPVQGRFHGRVGAPTLLGSMEVV